MNRFFSTYGAAPIRGARGALVRIGEQLAAARRERDFYRERLAEACAALEANARHAYVVCGRPDTQEAFEAAWQSEDPETYAQWLRLSGRTAQLSADTFANLPRWATCLLLALLFVVLPAVSIHLGPTEADAALLTSAAARDVERTNLPTKDQL